MKKIILTCFMAFVLLLAACGTDNENSDDSEPTTEENPATETEQPTSEDTEEPDDSNPAGETEEEDPTDSADDSSEEEPAADSETPDEGTDSTDGAEDTEGTDDTEDNPSAEKVTAAFNGMSDTHSMEVKMEDGSLAVINFHEEDAEVVNELQEGAKIKYVPVTEDSGMEYATELEVIE